MISNRPNGGAIVELIWLRSSPASAVIESTEEIEAKDSEEGENEGEEHVNVDYTGICSNDPIHNLLELR